MQQEINVKVKGNCHTVDIAPSEGAYLQKCSGMTRVVEEFYSFTSTLTR